MPERRHIDFWFSIGSTYTYLSVMRLKDGSRTGSSLWHAAPKLSAPTFAVGREIFWGNDRLEDALKWLDTPTTQ